MKETAQFINVGILIIAAITMGTCVVEYFSKGTDVFATFLVCTIFAIVSILNLFGLNED